MRAFLLLLTMLAAAVSQASDIERREDACPLPKSYEEKPSCVVIYLNQLTELIGRQANEIATGSMEPPTGFLAEVVAQWATQRDESCGRFLKKGEPKSEAAILRCKVELTESHYVFLESVIESERGLGD
jgi:uncharacterized protein YecT (DUF1311 family)